MLNDYNFYYETGSYDKGIFLSKKGFGSIDEGKLQYVDYNYREETEKKLEDYILLSKRMILFIMRLRHFN